MDNGWVNLVYLKICSNILISIFSILIKLIILWWNKSKKLKNYKLDTAIKCLILIILHIVMILKILCKVFKLLYFIEMNKRVHGNVNEKSEN